MRRRLAVFVCRALETLLPRDWRDWGRAIGGELAGIDDDGAALRFALGSFCGLVPQAIVARLIGIFAAPEGRGDLVAEGMMGIDWRDAAMRRPRALGLACAVGATGLGIGYLATAGAPGRYLGINAGAFAIGLAALAVAVRARPLARRWSGATVVAMAVALLATALLGDRVEGAARWVRLGALFVQPSLVLLPAMILGFVRSRSMAATVGMAVAAAALAIQPDRAMAGMLAAGLAVPLVLRPDRRTGAAFAAGLAGFAATLARADTLPAVPWVDRVLYTAFDVHPAAGLAVLAGAALMILPAIVGWFGDAERRETYGAFGIVWLAAIGAAAVGNYPTPIVGYGGSAIVGYVLCLAMLPRNTRVAGRSTHPAPRQRSLPDQFARRAVVQA